jgi:hypothetical protein
MIDLKRAGLEMEEAESVLHALRADQESLRAKVAELENQFCWDIAA